MGDTIQDQTRQCLTNIRAMLEAAGSWLPARIPGLKVSIAAIAEA